MEHYRMRAAHLMKTFLITISLSCILGLAACSRSDDAATAKPTPTPNPNLKKDAERLQQATANVAKEREKAAQATPTANPSP
jgi:hypothetical protein